MVCNWFTLLFTISMGLFSNICLSFKVDYLSRIFPTMFLKSQIASICLKFLVLIYQCQGQGVNLKNLHKAIITSKKGTLINFFFDIPIKMITVKA